MNITRVCGACKCEIRLPKKDRSQCKSNCLCHTVNPLVLLDEVCEVGPMQLVAEELSHDS